MSNKILSLLMIVLPLTVLFIAFNAKAEDTSSINNDKQQIKCMADSTYFEAGNQPLTSQIAISNVIINRTKNGDAFAKTPCGVVYQKTRKVCQFSWVCAKKHSHIDATNYQKAYYVAEMVYNHITDDLTNGALFFHDIHEHPKWKGMTKTAKLGQFIFYKLK